MESEEYKAAKAATITVPDVTFEMDFRIWRPSKWKKRQSKDGRWIVDKWMHFKGTSNFFGWRLRNLAVRCGWFIWNGAFWMTANVLKGPYGIRSLFGLKKFQSDKTIDPDDGEIINTGRKYHTWLGRIKALWEYIGTKRNNFKNEPDTGFLGKSIVNPFHWFWFNVCIGGIGTTVAFLWHPIITTLSTITSTLIGLCAPVWGPILSFAKYIIDMIIYDTDGVDGLFPLFYHLIWKILLRGVGQFLIADIVILMSFLFGNLMYAWATLRAGCRITYDAIIYGLFIKPFGKVPFDNSWSARLVSGPGLSMEYFYQITPETVQLLAAINLEKKEMNAYVTHENNIIDGPLRAYTKFLESFAQHGLSIDQQHITIQKMQQTANKYKQTLTELVREHWRIIGLDNYDFLNFHNGKCRLTRFDLQIVMDNIASMCEQYYSHRIFPLMDDDKIRKIWIDHKLAPGDWLGLGKHHLQSIFGDSIFQPIEDIDNAGFRLEIQHIDTKKYFNNIWHANIVDDLDDFKLVDPVVSNDAVPISTHILVTPYDVMHIDDREQRLVCLKQQDVDDFIKRDQKRNNELYQYGAQ
jgi:hypothetical protein